MNAPHPQSHEARLIAARRFIEADAVLTQAMRDGINFHGAVSGMVAAEDELRAAMSEHPAGVPVAHTDHPQRNYDKTCPACNPSGVTPAAPMKAQCKLCLALVQVGKPGPWRYFDGNVRPSVNTPDCCDVEPVYAAILAERERCAEVCEDIENAAWKEWKAKYKPYDEGRSDGAGECAAAIREGNK